VNGADGPVDRGTAASPSFPADDAAGWCAALRWGVTSGALALVAAVVFAWGAFSAKLERADLTAPMTSVGAAGGWLLTVLLSVVAHGASAGPVAVRYGAHSRPLDARTSREPAASARLQRASGGRDPGAAVTSGRAP
jgi:hypothetical protein